jgi:tetratricopeptide (TPR) repeat protein
MRPALAAVGVLATLALTAPPVPAQGFGGARGKVVEEDGTPVAEATVTFEYTVGTRSYEVKTNDKGEYIQMGIRPGRYLITATKDGFIQAAAEMMIGAGGMTTIPDLQLIPGSAPMGAAVAEALMAKFQEGVGLARDGQLDEAEAIFNEILDANSGIPEVHSNLGFIHGKRGDWAAAEASYKTALDLRPGDSAAVAALADVYNQTGREDEAMELLNQTAGDNPGDATSQFNRGVLLLNSGKDAEAQEAFEAVLAADPTMAEAHFFLGTILVGQGKVAESVEHLETYLATNPENAENKATAEGLIAALKQ